MNRRFRHFLAIDWSGAAGERHAGIAVALCDDQGHAPSLLCSPRSSLWSRAEVLDLLLHGLPSDTLAGLELGISLPFADAGAFLPGWEESPSDARSLWTLVESICAGEPHFGVTAFIDHPAASAHFRRHGGREGDRFHLPGAAHRKGRFRVAEQAQQAMGCKPYSNFNLVGAAQVGKSSLSGMRLLHALDGRIPVWPVDPLPLSGSVVVEIYTAIAAMAARRSANRSKIRDGAALDDALAALDSPPCRLAGQIDDHSADALITAAWLRTAAHRPELWAPSAMTPQIARTEGWTFGAA